MKARFFNYRNFAEWKFYKDSFDFSNLKDMYQYNGEACSTQSQIVVITFQVVRTFWGLWVKNVIKPTYYKVYRKF